MAKKKEWIFSNRCFLKLFLFKDGSKCLSFVLVLLKIF